jgi:hypothetical protein
VFLETRIAFFILISRVGFLENIKFGKYQNEGAGSDGGED